MERDHRYSDYSISKDSFINLRSNHFEAVNRKNNFKEALDILNGGSWMVPSEKNPALFDSFRYTMGDWHPFPREITGYFPTLSIPVVEH